MSGQQDNNGGDGSSRKRQYPFHTRGGARGRGRRGRGNGRGGAMGMNNNNNNNNSPTSPFSTSFPSFAPATASPTSPDASTVGSFSSLAQFGINGTLLNTLVNDMKIANMTPVQAETLPHTLTGSDVLAQAKTGTGKTIAFLLPAIQKLVTDTDRLSLPLNSRPISLLVISPTRELAIQIGDEAKRLLAKFPDHNEVQVAYGGTNPTAGYNKILKGCDILVATPGRLLDYLGSPDGGLLKKLQDVQTLVLDEADRLMDMGFISDIKKVVKYLPAQEVTGRTGMLFSATINHRVKQFASLVLSDNYKFVSTIPVGEAQTHEHVPQKLIQVSNFADLAPAIVGALRHEIEAVGKHSFKTIIFGPTAAVVDFYAFVISQFKDLPPTVALHSRISQSKRTSTTEAYRKAKNGILVATDVVARGLDFPGVTNVFQVGLPSEKEAYIHRLGRTARAGADGRGCLILANSESEFARTTMSMIKFIPTEADLSSAADVRNIVRAMEPILQAKAYRAWIGYYKTHIKLLGWNTTQLVQQANKYALEGLGCDGIPDVETSFVGKTGLKGVPGLNIVKSQPRQPRGGGGGR